MAKADLTAERLRELLHYDPETGVFVWMVGIPSRIRAGDVAGSKTDQGYIKIKISQTAYKAHRLAWLYVYGEWPRNTIDHIDGKRDNNKISNLRDVTTQVNLQNMRRARATAQTRVLGVTRDGRKGRNGYVAQISHEGRTRHIGTFQTPEAAHEAYLAAKRRLHEGCTI